MSASKIKKIILRDGNKCWLCGCEVDENSGRKMQPSVDHVVPRKFGGSNSIENLRLAHQYCNSIREGEFPKTMIFTIEQIEKFTNRNSETGSLSKKAMKAVRKIEKRENQ